MGIFRLIKFSISLVFTGTILFFLSLYIPAYLLTSYGETYMAVNVTPYTSTNFIEWAKATEIAIDRSKKSNKLDNFLQTVIFPGYRLDLYQIKERMQKDSLVYEEIIAAMRQTFENDSNARQQWEKSELGRKFSGPEDVKNISQQFMAKAQIAHQSLLRYYALRKNTFKIGFRFQGLKKHLEEEKDIVFAGTYELLTKAWEGTLNLLNKASDATNSNTAIENVPLPANTEPTEAAKAAEAHLKNYVETYE